MTHKSKLFLSIIVICCFSSLLAAQKPTWHWMNPYPLPFIGEMKVTTDNQIYFTHHLNEVYFLEDDEFVKFDMNLPDGVFGYFTTAPIILDKKTWIIDQRTHFFITTDGGVSYSEFNDNCQSYGNYSFFDEKNGVCVRNSFSGSKTIIKTSDSGKSWEKILDLESTGKTYMASEDTIYVLDNDYLKTTFDGGINWVQSDICKDCQSFLVLEGRIVFQSYCDLFYSDDYGVTIRRLNKLDDDISTLPCLIRSHSQLDNNMSSMNSLTQLFISYDGWDTYSPYLYATPRNTLLVRSIIFNENHIYLESNPWYTSILKFSTLEKEFENLNASNINSLLDLDFSGDSTYVLTSRNEYNKLTRLYISNDLGYTWKTIEGSPEDKHIISKIEITADKTAIFLSQKALYTAIPPYSNWTKRFEFGDGLKYDMKFYDELNGICASGDSSIFLTYDGGYSWDTLIINQYESTKKRIEINKDDTTKAWILAEAEPSKNLLIHFIDNGKVDTTFETGFKFESLKNALVQDDYLYVSSRLKNFRIQSDSLHLQELCDILKGTIIKVFNEDSIWIQTSEQLLMININCEIKVGNNLKYSDQLTQPVTGNFSYHFSSSGEAIGWNSGGRMLKYTANFREDLLVSSEEIAYEPAVKEDIVLYPNPTNGLVYLKGVPMDVDILIYDIQGQLQAKRTGTIFDVSGLATGLYFVQILSGDRVLGVKKMILN